MDCCSPDRGFGRGGNFAERGAACGVGEWCTSVGQYCKSRATSTDGDEGIIMSIVSRWKISYLLAVIFHRFPPSFVSRCDSLHFPLAHDRRQGKTRGWMEKCAFGKEKKGKNFPPSLTRFLFSIIDREIVSTFKLFLHVLLSLRKSTQSAVFFFENLSINVGSRDVGQAIFVIFHTQFSQQTEKIHTVNCTIKV